VHFAAVLDIFDHSPVPQMKKKSGFTLIELLVVIAIIAILAALAAPGLAKWIENTRALSDASTMRQLGMLLKRYLDEHEDEMPALAGTTNTWPQMLHKITPDYKVFVSPFDKRPLQDGTGSPVSYGINQNTFGKHDSQFNSPSELFMLAPVANGGSKPAFTGTVGQNVAVTSATSAGIFKNHNMLNVAFADNHILPMSISEFQDQASIKGKKHWQPEYVDPTSQ
jgi:prepilin-type N-terminal cleavage/methylation domain-containing protein